MNRSILLFVFFLPLVAFSQLKTIGSPAIQNYPKSTYKGATQNWDIAQDRKGYMYFANNDGVLRFDGLHWELLDTNIPGPVRSVFVDSQDRIFVGSIDNFGILEQNSARRYQFHSLRHLLDKSISFSDLWRIHEIDQGIVFQSFEKLFIYDNQEIKVFSPEVKYRFSFNVNGKLLIQDIGLGLFEYVNGNLEKVPWANSLINKEILSIQTIDENKLLIGTVGGLYQYKEGKVEEWKCQANDFIKTNKLFCSAPLIENHIAFGTILNGVLISDIDGNIVQHLNRNKGLQNNTILSLSPDVDGNLWLGLDNGIDYIEINSPVSSISEGGRIGSGYCCIIHNDKLYLGTNQGLYVKPFKSFSQNEDDFKLIEKTEGQVWSLAIFDNQLICGHNLGTFVINNETATQISNEPGGWTYVQLKNDPNILIGGFYSGLGVFKKGSSGWQFDKKLEGFSESSRFLVEDEHGYIWVTHGSKGVFKINLNEKLNNITDYKVYNQNSGLPSDQHNIVFSLKGKGYISTIAGIYQYQNSEDIFSPSVIMNELLGGIGRIKTVKEDMFGNIWYISQYESGVLRQNEDKTYTKITNPFKKLDGKYVNEFEFIYPFNNEHTFFGTDYGFAHYSSQSVKSYSKNISTFITRLDLPYIDSVYFPKAAINEEEFGIPEFPYARNNFRFHYTSPFYEDIHGLTFSYYLDNYSEKWSDWSTDSYRDFTNLYEGDYSFKVKSKNIYGTESEIAEFKFTITPPWHRSKIAYFIYLVLIIVFILFLVRFILYRMELSRRKERRKHEKEIRKKDELFQHQAVVAEKEIIRLRNEKLRGEMVHRDKELANQTMGIIQKNRFLIKINEDLRLLQNSTEVAAVRNKISTLKKRIKKETDDDSQKKVFEAYFDEVHNDFFNSLLEKYPELTPGDLRLCAYIKMNISTKEIASLLNISYRGVEISRYRLRKKLDLSRDINLSAFLLNI